MCRLHERALVVFGIVAELQWFQQLPVTESDSLQSLLGTFSHVVFANSKSSKLLNAGELQIRYLSLVII